MNPRLLIGAALVSAATPAVAHADLFSGDQLRGTIDVRTGVADGEQSWLREGMGKTRLSGSASGDEHGVLLGQGFLIWHPHFTWSLDGTLTLHSDSQLEPSVDVTEAFLSYRAPPHDGWRFSGRAGLFYPPVSLEHDGPGWTTTNTITPSAINSWIGEEVKVVGAEATAHHRFGEHDFSGTLGLFGYNDTSGTLLAFRGWALGDVLPGVSTSLPMPERSFPYQEGSRATTELDGRVGYYARFEYKPSGPITLDIMHYDNAGDRRSDAHGQTDWETRFTNVGMRMALGDNTRLLAQAMTGQTVWGYNIPGFGYWMDQDFGAAYVLLAHDFGEQTISGRLDYFEISDNNPTPAPNNDENGWAATADYQIALSRQMRLAFELLHVSSERQTRVDQGVARQQDQTTLQSSLRYGF